MASEVCTVCGGTEAEHKNRLHAFTTKEGDLRPPSPARAAAEAATTPLHRLCSVLASKGVLDLVDLEYINSGAVTIRRVDDGPRTD